MQPRLPHTQGKAGSVAPSSACSLLGSTISAWQCLDPTLLQLRAEREDKARVRRDLHGFVSYLPGHPSAPGTGGIWAEAPAARKAHTWWQGRSNIGNQTPMMLHTQPRGLRLCPVEIIVVGLCEATTRGAAKGRHSRAHPRPAGPLVPQSSKLSAHMVVLSFTLGCG
jgi:hypothetical protein